MLRAVGGTAALPKFILYVRKHSTSFRAFHSKPHPGYLFDEKRSSRPPWTSKATTKVPSFRLIKLYQHLSVIIRTWGDFKQSLFRETSSLLSFTASGNQDLTWMLSLVGPLFGRVTSLDNPEKHPVEVTPPDIAISHLKDPTGMTHDDHWLHRAG